VNHQNEMPGLLKQRNGMGNSWILLKLIGKAPNTSSVGATVRLKAGGRLLIDEVRSGGSYLSQSDFRVHFGLREAQTIEKLEIEWPDGCQQTRRSLAVNQVLTIQQECEKRSSSQKVGRDRKDWG
jgi:enediyne biosynthesis protein E4